jgi:hypothetical protein
LIHHIAIATPNLKFMADFYQQLPGLAWKENKFTEDNRLRSVWLQSGNNCILMLEEFPYSKAPEALVFQFETSFDFSKIKIVISKRTDYTFYFSDPDGNQLGYSSYPNELDFTL